MSWSSIWDSVGQEFGFSDEPEAPAVTPQGVSMTDPGLAAGLSSNDIAEIDGAAPAKAKASANWWEQPLKQVMPAIMGAALKPQAQQRAPVAPSGHGVNANTSGLMKPVDELSKAANNNPLADLNKWSGLFK